MPEDNEAPVVNEAAVEETATPESTTEETNSPTTEAVDSEESQSTETEGNEEQSETTDETDEDDQPKSRADQRKEQLDSEIEDLERKLTPQEEIRQKVARRNELRQQIEARNAQLYKAQELPTIEQLLEEVNPESGDYYTRMEAKIAVMEAERQAEKQESQFRQYNDQVAESLYTLESETTQALKDFPMFDESHPDYSSVKGLAEEAAVVMSSALQKDAAGNLVGSAVSPYQLYNLVDKAMKLGAQKAQTKGQKSVEKMLSNADNTPSGVSKEKKFEKMSLAQQTAYLRSKGHDV